MALTLNLDKVDFSMCSVKISVPSISSYRIFAQMLCSMLPNIIILSCTVCVKLEATAVSTKFQPENITRQDAIGKRIKDLGKKSLIFIAVTDRNFFLLCNFIGSRCHVFLLTVCFH